MMLSADELERYTRQIGLPDWGEDGQQRLQGARVFIAGSGGLGSAVALYLTAAGVGRITLCDPDTVELSNLNRQVLYSTSDIGQEKVTAASERLVSLNPAAVIVPLPKRIDTSSAPGLIAGHDIAIDCLDTLEARFVLNRACIALAIPMIYAAVSGFAGQLSLIHPPTTPCLECFIPDKSPPGRPQVPGCTAGVVGSLQATEAIKHITGIGRTLTGRLLVVDGMAPGFDVLEIERDPDCPACGSQAE